MTTISIRGTIVSSDDAWVYEWFGIEATSPNAVRNGIEGAKGGDLSVEINSGGGDVFAGSEIYALLKDYPGNVTTRILGIAASAASVIAMAGDRVLIAPTAQIMIHNVSSLTTGDYRDHEHEAGVLKNYNKSIANAYMLKSGMSQEELLELMNKESWFTAQEAKELKLADEIMFDNSYAFAASASGQMLPREVINKLKKDRTMELQQRKYIAKLNYLKLKGGIIDV